MQDSIDQSPNMYISKYLSFFFFQAVEKFEAVVDLTLTDPSDKQISIYKGKNSSLLAKKVCQLKPGYNKNTSIKLVIVRIINCSYLTFLLARESSTEMVACSQFHCLIVISPKEVVQKWEEEMGLNMTLLIKEPVLQTEIVSNMNILLTRLENIVLEPVKRWKGDIQEIRKKGKEMFSEKQFYDALLVYEYALACVEAMKNRRVRSIIYSNASACLYEMRLYNSSIRYANLSIKIDSNYSKGYFRKIYAMLEKKRFKQIPPLLLSCKGKVQQEQFTTLNSKFTGYIANSVGIFNWNDFDKNQGSENRICDYISRKVRVEEKNGTMKIIAKQDIEPYEFIMIQKPLYLANKNKNTNGTRNNTEIIQCLILEETFRKDLDDINESQNKKAVLQSENYNFESKMARGTDIMRPKQIIVCGFWKHLYKFTHACDPNCSYGFYNNVLVVSSSRNILAGDALTIDMCTYEQENRKKILLQKYNIICECRACEWEWWAQNTQQYIEIMEIIKEINNIYIKKKFFWLFLKNGSLSSISSYPPILLLYQDAISRYMSLVNEQTHWQDISNMKLLFGLKSVNEKLQKFVQQRTNVLFRVSPKQK